MRLIMRVKKIKRIEKVKINKYQNPATDTFEKRSSISANSIKYFL